jgi:hypothetical protein
MKMSVYSGSGNVIKLEEKTSTDGTKSATHCFYYVIRDSKSANDPESESSSWSSDYMLCLVRDFVSLDADLDVFRSELDAFCTVVTHDVIATKLIDAKPLSLYLKQWYDTTIEVLSRFTIRMDTILPELLTATILGMSIVCTAGDDSFGKDLVGFQAAMNVSSLWPHSDGSLACRSFATSSTPLSINMTSNGIVASNIQYTVPLYCKNWAHDLVLVARNPFSVKKCIQQRVLAIVKDINIFQRILGMAESHHYALFNAYQYLRSCSTTPSVVLASALLTRDESEPGSSHFQVLSVLGDFVQDKLGPNWFLNFSAQSL